MSDDREQPDLSEDLVISMRGVSKQYKAARSRGGGLVPSALVPRSFGKAGASSRFVDGADLDDEDEDDEDEELEEEPPQAARDVWALKDVTVDVPSGEGLGVIGPNGAGKSTLIRILARTAPPTTGRIVLRGRIAPTLHGASTFLRIDLTGRENIWLLGHLFGVPKEVTTACIDEVLSFAELDSHADTRVRHYSTGMLRRLAFSIAVNLQPDVLLIDGAAAVGDRAFRRRCLTRLDDLRSAGATLVVASHDLGLVRRYCDRVLLLDRGRVVREDAADEVTAEYGPLDARKRRRPGPEPPSDASDDARILNACLYAMTGEETDALQTTEDGLLEVAVEVTRIGVDLQCAIVLQADDGRRVRLRQPAPLRAEREGVYTMSVLLPGGTLTDGRYRGRVRVWTARGDERRSLERQNALDFSAYDSRDLELEEDEEELPALIRLGDLPWRTAFSSNRGPIDPSNAP